MDELQNIQNLIYVIRGQRVMLDFDLAKIYQVETKALNQAVKRNYRRFEGEEFMFQLTKGEWEIITKEGSLSIDTNANTSSFTDGYNLRSQIVTSRFSDKWGGNRRPHYAFSEIGVAMLSSVLISPFTTHSNPSSPTLSQSHSPVATTSTRIRQISWNQPKIPVPLQQ